MKVKISSIFILFALFSVYSCEKEDFKPATYQKSRFENNNVRLFQKGGEVFDAAKISDIKKIYEDHFSSLSASSKYTLDSNMIVYNEMDFSIEMLSPTKARFYYPNKHAEDYIIEKQSNEIHFIKDTVVSTWLFDAYFNVLFCKFSPAVIKTETEPNTTSPTTYYKPTIFAYEMNGEIHIPVISFFSTYNNNPFTSDPAYAKYASISSSRNQNSVDNNFISRIIQGLYPEENIIFRESVIVFSKE